MHNLASERDLSKTGRPSIYVMPIKHMTQIRYARAADAASLVWLFKQLDEETNFMLFEPRERIITEEQQAQRLLAFEGSPTETMFVAESIGTILGFAVGIGGSANRTRHSLSIVIGVLRAHWNKGVGRELMKSVEAWAQAKNMHRLELSVMANNTQAIKFYEKHGFGREGIKRNALLVEGKYVNEIYMSKLI